MQKGWKSCSPCGMCLKTRFFSWKAEFSYHITRSDLTRFSLANFHPLGLVLEQRIAGSDWVNSSSWETWRRVQPQSWYNFQRNVSFVVLNNVSSSWLIVDLEIASLKRAFALELCSLFAASGVLTGVNFGCCSDCTSSDFCYGRSFPSLWGKAMERWYLQSLEYGLWGKVIKTHKTLSTGNEHNVKIWNFTKFIHTEGWIVSLFPCLWANEIPHVQTMLQLKPYAEIFVAISFPCKNQHRFYCKPVHCMLGSTLSFLLCLRCGFGELHQTKFNCGRPNNLSWRDVLK